MNNVLPTEVLSSSLYTSWSALVWFSLNRRYIFTTDYLRKGMWSMTSFIKLNSGSVCHQSIKHVETCPYSKNRGSSTFLYSILTKNIYIISVYRCEIKRQVVGNTATTLSRFLSSMKSRGMTERTLDPWVVTWSGAEQVKLPVHKEHRLWDPHVWVGRSGDAARAESRMSWSGEADTVCISPNAHVRKLCQVISLHDHPQGLKTELRSWDISTRIFFFFNYLIILNLRSAPSDLKALSLSTL